MRATVVLLAVASLSACSQPVDEDAAPKPAVDATPAALMFEGADTTDPAKRLAHGERLSWVLGCTGCHTPSLQGKLFNEEDPALGKLYASNLTRILPAMSDAQLETLLRTGRHPTRGDLWVMPSEVFQRLSEEDMGALIAHLRTIKPAGAPTPPPALSPAARELVKAGKVKPVAQWVAAFRTQVPADLGPAHRWGRHLASVTCAECHGGDLTGIEEFEPGVSTPNLDIAGAYSDAELNRLLTTGEGKTRKDLGLMTLVGKGHFSRLTQRERDAIIGYLKARAARPQ
jgi:cytochrome c553